MNVVSIHTKEGHEINLNAELVHCDSVEIPQDDGFSREFTLRLYAIDGGGYAPLIEYHSNAPSETSTSFCEETDSIEDGEKFYYVFDVCEVVPCVGEIDRLEKEERTKLTRRLAKEYENLMIRFLDTANSQISIHGYTDRIPDTTIKSGSFWKLFKTK